MLEGTYIVRITNEGEERAFSASDVKLAIENEARATIADEVLETLTISVEDAL